mgnify:CR=1 FL=1
MAKIAGSKISQLERKQLAIRMIEKGFKNTVIELATGESNSMIRAYRKDADTSKLTEDSISGQLKMASRIVDNRRRMLEAGVFVAYYLGLVRNRFKAINYDALMRAYDLYMEYHRQINLGRVNNSIALTINEAFVLVRDMRSHNAGISINSCKCQAIYITVADQRMRAGCPACSIANSGESLEDDDESLADLLNEVEDSQDNASESEKALTNETVKE